MSTAVVLTHPWVAQTPLPREMENPVWTYTSGGLACLLLGLGIMSHLHASRLRKQLRFETAKNRELQKRLKRALITISKMERNPDLIHSREFNLDYLRMRMEEDQFHFAIVNQLKVKIRQNISLFLRPKQAEQGLLGIASKARVVDQTFDVEYVAGNPTGEPTVALWQGSKRVLFRVQVKLTKLPTQPTSVTIEEIINCIETFLSPDQAEPYWQPTLLGRLASLRWDQKAKPTPLLVLEQTAEGVNVTFRSSNRRVAV